MPLPQSFHDVAAEVRNWGRWGDNDVLGTLNLLTDDTVAAAAASIRTGARRSLALPLKLDGIQIGAVPGRLNPMRTMIAVNHPSLGDPDGFCTSDDVVFMGLQAATHWDGLGHVSYGGRLYNGYDAATINEWGAHKVGIENVTSLTGRGVLLDVARAKGVDMLDGGYAVTGDDLDEAAAFGNVEIRSGDIVMIRTGRMAHVLAHDNLSYLGGAGGTSGSPGPGVDAVRWFHRYDIAAAATDTYTFEVFPSEDPAAVLAVHMLDLVEMGMIQGQNWNLEVLAADCAADGAYDCFLEASPQPFVGGCGSPVNPVAIR